uniref:Uncharacterized protein n=1 Tax=Glossina palpalis gambiensis TaxID=67801 RepID=A0A1B0BAF4_9MUSC
MHACTTSKPYAVIRRACIRITANYKRLCVDIWELSLEDYGQRINIIWSMVHGLSDTNKHRGLSSKFKVLLKGCFYMVVVGLLCFGFSFDFLALLQFSTLAPNFLLGFIKRSLHLYKRENHGLESIAKAIALNRVSLVKPLLMVASQLLSLLLSAMKSSFFYKADYVLLTSTTWDVGLEEMEVAASGLFLYLAANKPKQQNCNNEHGHGNRNQGV